jgi:hypothetical protein
MHRHRTQRKLLRAQIVAKRAFSTFQHVVHHDAVGRTAARTLWAPVKLLAFMSMFASSSTVEAAGETPVLLGIPVEFMLFALTLVAVAVLHHYTMRVALTGLIAIVVYKLASPGSRPAPALKAFCGTCITSGCF